MIAFVYSVIFGYIGSLFFEGHYTNLLQEVVGNAKRRYDVIVGLFQRLSHPKFRHPV